MLRAVGNYLDFTSYRDITLVEMPDGFVVKGMSLQTIDRSPHVAASTYLFSNDDLEALLDQALQRRNLPLRHGAELHSFDIDGERLRYEDALRAIGSFIDTSRWRQVVIMQTARHFNIKGIIKETPVHRLIDVNAMRELLEARDPGKRPKRRFGFR